MMTKKMWALKKLCVNIILENSTKKKKEKKIKDLNFILLYRYI